jgi:hypothetical protein
VVFVSINTLDSFGVVRARSAAQFATEFKTEFMETAILVY